MNVTLNLKEFGYLLNVVVILFVVEVNKMREKQSYNKLNSNDSMKSTNASYNTEFASETDVEEVRKENAQAEAKKSQASNMKQ